LPALLTFSSAGVISGIPTAIGTSTFTVGVIDTSLQGVSQSFALTIDLGSLAITTPSTLPSGAAGAPYSQTLAATGGVPPYTWQVTSGAWPPGLALSTGGVISGTPTALGNFTFVAQVQDSSSSTASQPFSLTVTTPGALSRVGVISHLAMGAGWDSTIWLVNRSAAPVQASLIFHGNDGSKLSLQVTITQPGSTLQGTEATVNATIAPNTTLVVATGASATDSPPVVGWADVLGNGPLSGFAVFRKAGAEEAAVPLQGQIGTSISLPFDNTGGYSTGIALVNLSNAPASVTATVWDENGKQIGTQPIAVAMTQNDADGNGHDSFMLPDRLAVTANIRGVVQFQGNPGTAQVPAGQLTGLGLKADPNGLVTSLPTIVP